MLVQPDEERVHRSLVLLELLLEVPHSVYEADKAYHLHHLFPFHGQHRRQQLHDKFLIAHHLALVLVPHQHACLAGDLPHRLAGADLLVKRLQLLEGAEGVKLGVQGVLPWLEPTRVSEGKRQRQPPNRS